MNTLTIFLFFVENELCVTIEDVTSVSINYGVKTKLYLSFIAIR